MSIVALDEERRGSKVVAIDNKTGPRPRKVLDEDEYLDRMAKIIKRDFFLDLDSGTTGTGTPGASQAGSERSHQVYTETPGTDRTDLTTTSSLRSMRDLRSMRLNEYLEKYTSEDNAYFDKLQRKDLKRHRARYPWLYVKNAEQRNSHLERKQLTSGAEKLAIEGPSGTMSTSKEWCFNKNSLFYPPEQVVPQRAPSTVNYESSKYMQEPIFKEPLPVKSSDKSRRLNRFADKVGIDGNLLNGSETPSMNGYSFVPAPDTPKLSDDPPRSKLDAHRFYMPSESPRDDLAHRLYEEKIAKKIRTPRTGTRSDSTKTPKSRLDKIF